MDLPVPDDLPPHALDGIAPETRLERTLLHESVPVPADRVRLAHDILRLLRLSAFVFHGETDAKKYPPAKIWGLSIEKVGAHHARLLGDAFTKEFRTLTWTNAFNKLRTRADATADDAPIDIAPTVRDHLEGTSRASQAAPMFRDESWTNFQLTMRTLAPIFSGEVKRADLSA